MNLHVGTSGYSYKEWKGSFYPEKIPAKEMLRFYSERLSTVEINATFYRMPQTSMLENWKEQVPGTFRFALKASQRITHFKRLIETVEETKYFLETASVLGEQLGVVLFQLPPNMKADAQLLSAFMATLPKGVQVAFEFRHESWFGDDVFSCLKQHNRALCVAETEERVTPDVVTADFAYYRYRKPEYSEEERQAMVRRLHEHMSAGRDVFAYFKHEETPQGAIYAVNVLKEAGKPLATD